MGVVAVVIRRFHSEPDSECNDYFSPKEYRPSCAAFRLSYRRLARELREGDNSKVMHEKMATAIGSIQKSMKAFIFGVSVAATAWQFASARPAGTQAEPKFAWSPNLNLRSTDDIPKRLREPEGPGLLALEKGKESLKAVNCEEYLNAVSAGFHPATNHDNELSTEFVHDCFVLRDLQHVRAPTASGSYRLTKDSLTQLPPMLVRGAREVTDAAEQAEQRGESWKQFDPDLKVTRIDADSLNAEDKDTTYFLTFRAKGDFTGDGVEQIAFFASANGKHGSWYHVEYLILSPTNHGTLVRVTEHRAPYRVKTIQRAENH